MLKTFGRVTNPAWLLAGADAVVSFSVFWLAVFLRFDFDGLRVAENLGEVTPRAFAFATFVMIGLLCMGMYRARQRPRLWELVARVVVAVLLGALAFVLFMYLVPPISTGRGALGIAMAAAIVALAGVRWQLLRLVDFNPAKRRVLVLGAGRTARKIAALRRRSDRRRFDVVGYVPATDEERAYAEELGLGPLVDLDEGLEELNVDKIVVALDERRGAFPTRRLLERKFAGTPVLEIVEFLEAETEKIDLDVLHPGWLVFAASGHTDMFYRVTKRIFDLVVSSLLLLLTAPLFLLVIAGIKLEEGLRAPVFYRQRRVGRRDRTFMLLKFRSMCLDAEADGAQWAARRGDSRVTRVGRVIRRFRIDELPQVLNVLAGTMSIVGPRPERPEFVEQLAAEVPLYDYRHCVRPGLTGWAQLNFPYGASIEDAREKLKYDLYYIKNGNVVFDLFVLLQTVEVVLWGRAISMAGPRPPAEPETAAEQAQMQLVRRDPDRDAA